MRTRCRRQLAVLVIAVLAWLVVLALIVLEPAPENVLRLPFFAVLGVAVSASGLAALPWLLAGIIQDKVLLYVAGYFHGEADERRREGRPELTLISGGQGPTSRG